MNKKIYAFIALILGCLLSDTLQADGVVENAWTGAAVGSLFGQSTGGALAGAIWGASSENKEQENSTKKLFIVNNTRHGAWIGIHREGCSHYSFWLVHNTVIAPGGSEEQKVSGCSTLEVEGVLGRVAGDPSKNITLKAWRGPLQSIRLQIVDEGNDNYSIKPL